MKLPCKYGPYLLLERVSVGGMAEVPELPRGGVLVVLYSEDLEASLRVLRGAGAEITREPFAFPGGRRFQFRDPSGNELAVWAPE